MSAASESDAACAPIELSTVPTTPAWRSATSAGRPPAAGALGVGKLCEERSCQLDIRQQSLRSDGVGVGGIEIMGVVLHRDGEMLLDRGGAGQRRGVQP